METLPPGNALLGRTVRKNGRASEPIAQLSFQERRSLNRQVEEIELRFDGFARGRKSEIANRKSRIP